MLKYNRVGVLDAQVKEENNWPLAYYISWRVIKEKSFFSEMY